MQWAPSYRVEVRLPEEGSPPTGLPLHFSGRRGACPHQPTSSCQYLCVLFLNTVYFACTPGGVQRISHFSTTIQMVSVGYCLKFKARPSYPMGPRKPVNVKEMSNYVCISWGLSAFMRKPHVVWPSHSVKATNRIGAMNTSNFSILFFSC